MIALDVGSEAEELVTQFAKPSTLPEFFIAMSVTALALGGIWMAIQFVESSVKRLTKDSGLMMASTAALGLGVHNIGEGVGIAAALISGTSHLHYSSPSASPYTMRRRVSASQAPYPHGGTR